MSATRYDEEHGMEIGCLIAVDVETLDKYVTRAAEAEVRRDASATAEEDSETDHKTVDHSLPAEPLERVKSNWKVVHVVDSVEGTVSTGDGEIGFVGASKLTLVAVLADVDV